MSPGAARHQGWQREHGGSTPRAAAPGPGHSALGSTEGGVLEAEARQGAEPVPEEAAPPKAVLGPACGCGAAGTGSGVQLGTLQLGASGGLRCRIVSFQLILADVQNGNFFFFSLLQSLFERQGMAAHSGVLAGAEKPHVSLRKGIPRTKSVGKANWGEICS